MPLHFHWVLIICWMNLDRKLDSAEAECSAFGGDFQCDDDDVHRGTVLGAAGGDGFAGACDFGDPFSCPTKEEKSFGVEGQTMFLSGERGLWRFDEGVAPPASPSDPLFQFEATTTFVKIGPSPAKLANSLLAFFASEATASVTKVTPKKCTMKVHIDCQGFVCELKVRLYQHPEGHAVEFQRRTGEIFVFAAIYNRAADHLKALADFLARTVPEDQFDSFASESLLPSSLACKGELHCEPTELVMLPLLMMHQDANLLSAFPCEAPTGLATPPADDLGSTAAHGNSYWGPLALPRPALAA